MYLVIGRCTRSTRRTFVKLVPLYSGVQYSSIGRAKAQYNIYFVLGGSCHSTVRFIGPHTLLALLTILFICGLQDSVESTLIQGHSSVTRSSGTPFII